MDDDGEPAQRGATLDVGDQVRRDLDALVGGSEHEVAGMEDEIVVLVDDGFGDVLVDLPFGVGMDTGDVRPLKLEEFSAQSEVDARGLDL